MRTRLLGKFGFLWATLFFFALTLAGHWVFAWLAFVDEARQHGTSPELAGYVVVTLRDMFENWQSEFLQLAWQVAGLAYLWYVGSPQSKEGDDRKEEKLDAILRRLDPQGADGLIRELDSRYPKR
jgi:hypothetical protein